MKNQSVFILFILLSLALEANNKNFDCPTVPENKSWSGKTTGGTKGKYGSITNASIKKTAEGQYTVSDLTAGYFLTIDVVMDLPVEIEIDCEGKVTAGPTVLTHFGYAIITGGSWDEEQQKLTLHWDIALNSIKETSIFEIIN